MGKVAKGNVADSTTTRSVDKRVKLPKVPKPAGITKATKATKDKNTKPIKKRKSAPPESVEEEDDEDADMELDGSDDQNALDDEEDDAVAEAEAEALALNDDASFDGSVADEDDLGETEAEAGADVSTTDKPKKKSHDLSKRRAKRFRKMAREASCVMNGVGNLDAMSFIISPHDMQRLFHYTPAGDGVTYSEKEVALRNSIQTDLRITPNALQVAQVHVDRYLRSIMHKCVRSIMHTKRVRIAPSTVAYCLEQYANGGEFTSVAPPAGLLFEAFTKKTLSDDGRYDDIEEAAVAVDTSGAARALARAENKASVRALLAEPTK